MTVVPQKLVVEIGDDRFAFLAVGHAVLLLLREPETPTHQDLIWFHHRALRLALGAT